MYAVIEDSGQQFRVSEGDVLEVDLRELAEDAKELTFERVLLVSDEKGTRVGTPFVTGATVLAEIVDPYVKGEKVYHFHLRRRKASRRKTGHRQKYVRIRVTKINA